MPNEVASIPLIIPTRAYYLAARSPWAREQVRDEAGSPVAIAGIHYIAACPGCGEDVDWFGRQQFNVSTTQTKSQVTVNCKCNEGSASK